jgi:transcriptional regulator with XRE-family HTH domain
MKAVTKMRQKEIATKLGRGEATVSRWLKGETEPDAEVVDNLRALLEENARLTEAKLIAEVATSEDMIVVLDSKSQMLSLSKGFRDVMVHLGIETWDTDYTDDGLLRVIKVQIKNNPTKPVG